jgi:hypothetical protein
MRTMKPTYICRTMMLRPAMLAMLSTAVALVGATVARAEPSVPSADQLTTQVSMIFDLDTDRVQRASYLEAGDAALPMADTVAGPMNQHRSMVSIRVEDPTLDGKQLNSRLVMSVMGMGAQSRPLTWIERDGVWKLSTGSLCSIYTETSRTSNCPV